MVTDKLNANKQYQFEFISNVHIAGRSESVGRWKLYRNTERSYVISRYSTISSTKKIKHKWLVSLFPSTRSRFMWQFKWPSLLQIMPKNITLRMDALFSSQLCGRHLFFLFPFVLKLCNSQTLTNSKKYWRWIAVYVGLMVFVVMLLSLNNRHFEYVKPRNKFAFSFLLTSNSREWQKVLVLTFIGQHPSIVKQRSRRHAAKPQSRD